MKNLFNTFFYASLIFLIWTLYQQDMLIIPKIRSILYLIGSLCCVVVGFLILAEVWREFFGASEFTVNYRDCLAATGLTVFGKYIPGKIWLLLGVAGYVTRRYPFPLADITVVTFRLQFAQLWVAVILGAIGLVWVDGLHLWGWLVLILFLSLTFILFSRTLNGFAERVVRIVLRRQILIPVFSLRSIAPLLPALFANWIVWSIGLHLFILSLFDLPLHPAVGLSFTLSTALGIVVVFAPGGLGVREGIIVAYLVQSGLLLETATTISVAARMWFLMGEIVIFLLGGLIELDQPKIEGDGAAHDAP